MKTLRDSVYILVAVGSLAMAVCQPSEADADPSRPAVVGTVAHVAGAIPQTTARSNH